MGGFLFLESLQLIGVQPDGEGAVVDQVDLHHGAEATGFHVRHVLAGAFDELLVKPFGLVGRAGAGEGGPVALLAVGVQRELRNDERLSVHIGKRAVRLAVLVLEDAQLEDLAPQPLDLLRAVVRAHAQQDQVPVLARAHRFAVDIHLRMRHALHQCPHKAPLRILLTSITHRGSPRRHGPRLRPPPNTSGT